MGGRGRAVALGGTGRGGGCSCFSAPMEPCPDHAHRRPRCLGAADSSSPPASFLSRWFSRAFAAAPGHEVVCRKPLLSHRFPIAVLVSSSKMQPGCFPVSPSLRPSLAVISLSPGSGIPQVRCPRAGTPSRTRRQGEGRQWLPVGCPSPGMGWGRALCSQSRQPSRHPGKCFGFGFAPPGVSAVLLPKGVLQM